MDTIEILTKARKLIERRENWCQGDYALDEDGQSALPETADAKRFCSVGCIIRAANLATGGFSPEYPALVSLAGMLVSLEIDNDSMVVRFNDTHTHPEVLALFDRAIAAEKAKLGVATLLAEVHTNANEALSVEKTPEAVI